MVSNTKRIIVHIGAHKTGTTSLQYFCTHNRDTLLERGIFYPDTSIGESNLGPYGRNRFVNGYLLTNKYYNYERLANVLAEYQSNPQITTLFFSEENLFYNSEHNHQLNKAALQQLQQHNVHVVVTLRRAIEYLCGIWQEFVRFKCSTDLNAFLKVRKYTLDLQFVDGLQDTFGKDKTHLLIYNPEENDEYNSIDQMMQFLGLHDHGLSQPDKHRLNVGLNRALLDNMCMLNKYVPDAPFQKYREYLPVTGNHSVLNSLSDHMIKKICDRYYPLESELAQKYLGQEYFYTRKYPKIYKQERASYSPNKSLLAKRVRRLVVREAFIDTYFKRRNSINVCIAHMYASLSGKRAIKLRGFVKALRNRIKARGH